MYQADFIEMHRDKNVSHFIAEIGSRRCSIIQTIIEPHLLLIFSSQSLHPLLRYGENTFCNLHYKPVVNVKYPSVCVEKNGKNIWAIMISNLFNNLNAVDMWITGSIALGHVPCLFPSSVIFPLTNDLMLIFIYNIHLSDIMASSGLLSNADKLKSSIIALKSTMQECLLANRGAPRPHIIGYHNNEWMHIHVHTNMRMWTHSIIWYCRVSFDPHHTCSEYFLQATHGLSVFFSARLAVLVCDLRQH